MEFNQLYEAMFSRYPISSSSTYYACLKEYATHDYESYDFIRMKDTPFAYLQREYYEQTKQDDIWAKCVYIPAKFRHYYSGKDYDFDSGYDYYSEFGKKYYVDKDLIRHDTDILSRTRPRKLYRIKFIDWGIPDQKHGIQYDLKYNYSGRMHLSKISIQNPTDYKATKIGEYNLKYDHFGEIPYDLLVTSDAWGYYSGVNYQDLNEKNYKKANPYYVTLGSLKEIQYPTGGTTEFEFESNQFGKYLHQDKDMVIDCENDYGGGLRIASITNWDSPSHDKMISKKTYKYTLSNTKQSSGIINNLPVFEWRDWTYPGNKICSFNIIRSCPIIPLVNSFSPCVGYSCVKEINADLSYNINWYSDMSNPKLRDERYFVDYTGSSVATPFDVYYTDKSYLRGKLLLSRYYNSNNELVKSTGYTYRPLEEVLNAFVSMDGIKVRQWAETYQYFVESNESYDWFQNSDPDERVELRNEYDYSGIYTHYFNMYTGGMYKLFYLKYDLKQINDTIFEKNGLFEVETKYTFNDVWLSVKKSNLHKPYVRVLSSKETVSGLQSYKESYQYENDFNSPLYSQYFDIKPTCVNTYLNGTLLKSERTIYDYFTKRKLYLPRKKQVKIGENGTYLDMVNYEEYSYGGNLARFRQNGVRTRLIWDPDENKLIEVQNGDNNIIKKEYEYYSMFGLYKENAEGEGRKHWDYDCVGRVTRTGNNDLSTSYTYHYRDSSTNVLEMNDIYKRQRQQYSITVEKTDPYRTKSVDFNIVHFPQTVCFKIKVSSQSGCAIISVLNSEWSLIEEYYVSNTSTKDKVKTLRLEPGKYTVRVNAPMASYANVSFEFVELSD